MSPLMPGGVDNYNDGDAATANAGKIYVPVEFVPAVKGPSADLTGFSYCRDVRFNLECGR